MRTKGSVRLHAPLASLIIRIKLRVYCYGARLVHYQQQLDSSGLWDDCDRCCVLLRALKKLHHSALFEMQYNRLYVDEVQDYSHVQLAIFFMLCSERNLFFAVSLDRFKSPPTSSFVQTQLTTNVVSGRQRTVGTRGSRFQVGR